MQFVGRLLGHGLDPAREKHVFVYTVIVYNPKAPNAWFKIQKVRNNECDLSLLQHRKITSIAGGIGTIFSAQFRIVSQQQDNN